MENDIYMLRVHVINPSPVLYVARSLDRDGEAAHLRGAKEEVGPEEGALMSKTA